MPTLAIEGRQVSYRDTGTGPTVVLLHCSSSHGGQWGPLTEALADRFRVIAPDLAGYGRSDRLPRDRRPYTVHDVEATATLIRAVGAPARVVGHSLGGTVGLHLAHRHPDLVERLAVIEPVLFSLLEQAHDVARVEYLDIASAMRSHILFDEQEQAAREFMDFWVAPGAFDAMPDRGRQYVVATIERVIDDWDGISMHAPGQLTTDDLSKLSLPLLVVCGGRTKESAAAIVRLIRAARPAAVAVDIPEASHMSVVSQPDLFTAHLETFLAAP